MLEQFAADDQNRIALKLYSGKQTEDIRYAELAKRILSAAGWFAENESSGRHIALMGANSPEWIVAFWAILRSGNKPYLVNRRHPLNMSKGLIETLGIK